MKRQSSGTVPSNSAAAEYTDLLAEIPDLKQKNERAITMRLMP